MILTLPQIPPSVNAMYVNVLGKGRVKSAAYRNWMSAARWTIAAQRPPMFVGPVLVSIDVEKPKRCRSDVDNRTKAILDCLTGLVWKDDSQVRRVSIGWAAVEGVVITVTGLVTATEDA
jgi:crossover junction endodeoxyribonuclease RusA